MGKKVSAFDSSASCVDLSRCEIESSIIGKSAVSQTDNAFDFISGSRKKNNFNYVPRACWFLVLGASLLLNADYGIV